MNIEDKIKESVALAPLTTFKIGGPAKYFIEITTVDELKAAVDWANSGKISFYILAGGSNVLVDDLGFDGLIIKMANQELAVKGERLEMGAGTEMAQAVNTAAGNNLSGLEWAIGIPGSVGGAVRGNAGAFGSSMESVVETVEVFSVKKTNFKTMSRNDCRFKYRDSIFKTTNDLVIFSIILKLTKGVSTEINAKQANYRKHRDHTQPKLPSAGCIFKNLQFDEIKMNNADLADEINEEKIVKQGKVGAGWLISKLDLGGMKIGGSKISLEHANFIVNTGKARAVDVVMLISYIKQQARDQFSIQLQEEIIYLGL
ncbi:UDP-N-acetylmuramate dehydrogenase [bacterium]|nr:UDP-N-acetylmuramate dehydrogenase [bacterium]